LRHKAHDKRRGFSIIEVLVAIGVVATGILALVAVFITASQSNQHGKDLSKAVFYARKISEVIRANGLAFATPTIPPNAATGINDAVGTFKPVADSTGTHAALLGAIRAPKLAVDPDTGVVSVVTDGLGDEVPDPADDKFERSIQMVRASSSPADYDYNLILMDVHVRWVGGRHGDGIRRVKVTSLLKEGN
jgi:type II secretory pathway pseudopilin PulG